MLLSMEWICVKPRLLITLVCFNILSQVMGTPTILPYKYSSYMSFRAFSHSCIRISPDILLQTKDSVNRSRLCVIRGYQYQQVQQYTDQLHKRNLFQVIHFQNISFTHLTISNTLSILYNMYKLNVYDRILLINFQCTTLFMSQNIKQLNNK